MKSIKLYVLATILLFLTVPAAAQTLQQIEQELVKNIGEVQKYSTYGSNYDYDKLLEANRVFDASLLKYTQTASTLNYKFPALSKLIQIATSEDGRFRVYSWDTELGGTMHEYSRLYQFKGRDGKIYGKFEETAETDGGSGSFVYDVFTVNARSGTFYIVCATFIASTNDHYQSARLFKIDGDKVSDDVKLIKTAEGLTNVLSFEYNFFSVVNRKERPIKLILFDKRTKRLKIPVVVEDKEFPNGRVTNKFISYRFNGTHFVKVK